MPDEQPRYYWDACVLLSYINGNPDRLSHIDSFMDKSGKDFLLVTSALSIIEVAFGKAEQDGQALDSETENKINGLWVPGSPIKVVEFYPLLAHEAKELMRKVLARGWQLKPLDAAHLVTARRISATEFHTYDDKLFKYNEEIGMKIGPPISATPRLPFP